MPNLKPGQTAPALSVPTVGGGTWTLKDQLPKAFTLVVFYRGYHCPLCKVQLEEINAHLGAFAERGVDVVAVSGDPADRAQKTKDEWGIPNLTLGYGQDEANMRAWDLYISESIKDAEPRTFAEPGLFLIKPDGKIQLAVLNSSPFARPTVEGLLKGVDLIQKMDYPPRGTK